jgi:hypothetical protein
VPRAVVFFRADVVFRAEVLRADVLRAAVFFRPVDVFRAAVFLRDDVFLRVDVERDAVFLREDVFLRVDVVRDAVFFRAAVFLRADVEREVDVFRAAVFFRDDDVVLRADDDFVFRADDVLRRAEDVFDDCDVDLRPVPDVSPESPNSSSSLISSVGLDMPCSSSPFAMLTSCVNRAGGAELCASLKAASMNFGSAFPALSTDG